jgi:hypothetical protein
LVEVSTIKVLAEMFERRTNTRLYPLHRVPETELKVTTTTARASKATVSAHCRFITQFCFTAT